MQNVVILAIAIFVSVFGAARTVQASAYDIVCEFKYKIGEESWVRDSTSGTTSVLAKKRRRSVIKDQKQKAREAGLSFKVVYLFCEDPWGNSNGDD